MADATPAAPSRTTPISADPPVERERIGAPLPTPPTSFVGREREVAAVTSVLRGDGVRLVTLTGPGGVGKTRLALRVASTVAPESADGAAFVPLAPVGDPDLVAPTVARSLGAPDADRRSVDRLARVLADRSLLLILDNFEHLLAAAPFIAELLAVCPGLRVLATSRAPLRLSGERAFPVPPLAVPRSAAVPTAEAATASEAVRLFVARAGAARPDFALSDANAPAVAEIVRRLDGLPLAVELAAARVAALPPATLLARLDRRLALLSDGPRDAPPRLRTMRDAIAWSYDLLPPDERTFFRRLAVFQGGFDLEAAEAVAGPGVDAVVGVASLVDASLLRAEVGADGEARYGLLETVRAYAAEQLARGGEEPDVKRRHTAHYLALAEAAKPHYFGPDQLAWLDRLEREHDNLRAALGTAVESGDTEAVQRLCAASWEFWFHRGHFREGRSWTERALWAGESSAPLRAEVLFAAGQFARHHGDDQRAAACGEEALARSRAEGFAFGVGLAQFLLANVAANAGERDDATTRLGEALAIFRAAGNARWIGSALGYLAALARQMGDVGRYEALSEEKLRAARSIGDAWGGADALANLAEAAVLRGDDDRALALRAESLATRRRLGNRLGLLDDLRAVAPLAARRRAAALAARLLGAEEAVRERDGFVLAPALRAPYQRQVEDVRAALGEDAFAAAWAEGRRLSIEQATAEAAAFIAAATVPGDKPGARSAADSAGLTRRELDVLRLVVVGRSDREIGEALSISPRTVGVHVTNLLGKLGLDSRTAAAAHAVRHGLV